MQAAMLAEAHLNGAASWEEKLSATVVVELIWGKTAGSHCISAETTVWDHRSRKSKLR